MRLSVLVTLSGLVSETRPVFFLGRSKETVVEPRRGEMTFGNGLEDFEKNRGSKVRGGPPSSKGNTIRAGGGVVPAVYDGTDEAKVRFVAKGAIELLDIVPQKLHPFPLINSGRLIPNLGPVNFGKRGLIYLRKGRNVIRSEPKRRNLGPRFRNQIS